MIPRIIHHVWPGTDEFRPQFHEWRASWMRLHPDWTFLFWRLGDPLTGLSVDDERVARLLADPLYSVVVKSDILRLHVLDRYGGVYVDTDFEALRSLDPLLGVPCFFGDEVPGIAGPSLIGAEPGHPFIREYLRRALSALDTHSTIDCNKDTHVITGPYLMTEVLKGRTDVVVHPPEVFYPTTQHAGAAYARHHFNGQTPQGWRNKLTVSTPEPERKQRLRVAVCHSSHVRCGIHEYGMQLDRALAANGLNVTQYTYATLGKLVEETPVGAVAFFHFEPGLIPETGFTDALYVLRDRGVKIVFCCHWYERRALGGYDGIVSRFVVHREYPDATNHVVIPLACPTYELPADKYAARKRLGLPVEATILTTLGFLTEWKRTPEIVEAILSRIRNDIFVQIHTPYPFNTRGTADEEARVSAVLEKYDSTKRFSFSTEFLPDKELTERVAVSDLGFLFHGRHTGSVSAATKQFVSARCPLVVTGSNHASDIRGGVVRVDALDPNVFADEVVRVANDESLRARLRDEMSTEYERMNMLSIGERYATLFRRLT